MTAVLTHSRDFLNRVHRHQEQNHRDDRAAQGFNHAQDAWVQGRYRPGGEQHEQRSDFVQLVDFNALAFTAQRFNHHTVEAFARAEVVAQEGFGDGDNRDDRIRRGEAQYAAEDEEHYGQYHHDVSARQDAGALLLCAITDQRQNRTRRRRHVQLVHHEAFNGVGDCHAVDQQDRVNREEVEQGNQFTCANAEMLFNNFSDVFARVFTGQHEACQTAVCEEGHRESNDSHDDQRNQTADACVDRKEQYTSADCCAVKAKHPHGIRFAPTTSGFNRSNGAGLSGFHLYLLEEANCQVIWIKADNLRLKKQGNRLRLRIVCKRHK
ncbi:hypothetical protein L1887_46749 [Cichorium endivia]|nr:hypothetical protein L1887_46749 [Cichorium endivia]